MEYLENIQAKSIVGFEVPEQNEYINKLECLEYFSIELELQRNHLMLEYEVIVPELPTYKINNNGYLYIYLPGDRVDDTAYLTEYRKILNIAKRNKIRKFVISITKRSDNILGALILLYPFLNNEHVLPLYRPDADIVAADLHIIRGDAFYYFPKIKRESAPHMKIDLLNIKLPYDELIIRSHQNLLGVYQLFRDNPKVTIYLSFFNPVLPFANIALLSAITDTDNNRRLIGLKYRTIINKNNSAYKLIRGSIENSFPEKYLPNA